MDDRVIRKVFSEIVAGFSIGTLNGKSIFVKHFTPIDKLEFDYLYQNKVKELSERGISTEKERLEILDRDGLWGASKEKEIAELREFISNLYQTKRSHYSLKEIEKYNQQIEANEKNLAELLTERLILIGDCAENLAKRKTDMEEVFASFYYDRDMQNKVFDNSKTDDLEDYDVEKVISLYNSFSLSMEDQTIKKVSISNEFQSAFSLTDNLYYFYGLPIAKLTQFQIRLANYGSYFKHILNGEQRPPDSIRNDPDKLEDWFGASTNIKKLIEKGEGEGKSTSIVGVSRKELEYLGVQMEGGGNDKSRKELKEKGELSAQDAIRLGLV